MRKASRADTTRIDSFTTWSSSSCSDIRSTRGLVMLLLRGALESPVPIFFFFFFTGDWKSGKPSGSLSMACDDEHVIVWMNHKLFCVMVEEITIAYGR